MHCFWFCSTSAPAPCRYTWKSTLNIWAFLWPFRNWASKKKIHTNSLSLSLFPILCLSPSSSLPPISLPLSASLYLLPFKYYIFITYITIHSIYIYNYIIHMLYNIVLYLHIIKLYICAYVRHSYIYERQFNERWGWLALVGTNIIEYLIIVDILVNKAPRFQNIKDVN